MANSNKRDEVLAEAIKTIDNLDDKYKKNLEKELSGELYQLSKKNQKDKK